MSIAAPSIRTTESANETAHKAAHKQGRIPQRCDVWKIAARLDADTKVAARDALAKAGFTRRASDIDAVQLARDKVHQARRTRFARKFGLF